MKKEKSLLFSTQVVTLTLLVSFHLFQVRAAIPLTLLANELVPLSAFKIELQPIEKKVTRSCETGE